MLVGSENGAVRIFPLVEGESLEHHIGEFSSYWTFNVHDNHYGHLTHICCSHDDKYVLTAGNDGNIFVFKACLEAKPKKKELLHRGDIKVRTGTVLREITVSANICMCGCGACVPLFALIPYVYAHNVHIMCVCLLIPMVVVLSYTAVCSGPDQ